MDSCEVLIVGGGPGGSSCARSLREAGADVIVIDKAAFPRDKVCAGWITPQVVTDLGLDLDEYANSRTLQTIRGFRAGVIGGSRAVTTTYDHAVSYGIRRCEFDHYLLERSGARLHLGESATSVRRDGTGWIVNERIKARMLIGAGGHFCPIARMLNRDQTSASGSRLRSPDVAGELRRGSPQRESAEAAGLQASAQTVRRDAAAVVAAQEAEFPVDARDVSFAVNSEVPELYFSADLNGYGWCFRKQNYLNIGLGLLDQHACSAATRHFISYLQARGRIPATDSWRWRGHAYLLAEPRTRRVVDEGVLLIGDSAGLAYPQSGEGIRPAIESGLMAAATILNASGSYSRDRLVPYEQQLAARFGSSTQPRSSILPPSLTAALAVGLMRVPSFVRHVVLDRWFLRSAEPALLH